MRYVTALLVSSSHLYRNCGVATPHHECVGISELASVASRKSWGSLKFALCLQEAFVEPKGWI